MPEHGNWTKILLADDEFRESISHWNTNVGKETLIGRWRKNDVKHRAASTLNVCARDIPRLKSGPLINGLIKGIN